VISYYSPPVFHEGYILKKLISILSLTILTTLLTGCGGSETAVEPPLPQVKTGRLTLGVTDAPVDDAQRVVVEFDGVAIKKTDGDELEFEFEPRQIDLLSLAGGGSELLLDDIELEAGEYRWIRLMVNAERGTNDSFIELTDTNIESLFFPSGAQTGLKLNDSFIILADGSSDLVIDFDLRKSITDPRGQSDYILKPRLRLIDNAEAGEIFGTVATELVTGEDCSESASVYVFDAEVGVDGVDDIDIPEEGDEDIGGADPITTATVSLDDEGVYNYVAAFLAPGDYVLGLTCTADLDENTVDNTETEENTPDQVVSFVATAEVSVVANELTEYNFEAN